MKTRSLICTVVLGVAFAGAPAAFAQTLYKLIDKDGKVTYSESKPKTFDGQVIPLNIDPNANTATLNTPAVAASKAAPRENVKVKQYNLEQAQARVDQAKAALQKAKDNPTEADQQIVGNKGGGVRFLPTEAYQERLKQLEQNVQDAEASLAKLEKGS